MQLWRKLGGLLYTGLLSIKPVPRLICVVILSVHPSWLLLLLFLLLLLLFFLFFVDNFEPTIFSQSLHSWLREWSRIFEDALIYHSNITINHYRRFKTTQYLWECSASSRIILHYWWCIIFQFWQYVHRQIRPLYLYLLEY